MLNLLELLKERKIVVSAVDGVLKVKAPKGAINAEVDGLLKLHKQELLEFLVRKSAQRAGDDGAALVPVQRGEASITSFPQQRLWFVDQLEGGSAQYNIPAALRLRGRLDEDALQRALDTIVERHEILRTTYRGENDAAMQVVQPARPVSMRRIDLTSVEAAARDAQVQTLAREEGATSFDLASDLMLRVTLVRLAAQEHVLLFTMHHIASDGWSMGVLVKEFVTLYGVYTHGDANPLPPLPIQYADYAYWQRQRLQGDNLQKELGYWKNRLSGIPQLHSLPLDKPRGARQNFIARKHTQFIERPVIDALQSLAREHDATLFMVLQSAYALLLARWSGSNDIVMSVPTAGRTMAAIEPLIGFFINTLIFRTELSSNDTFHDLLTRAKRDTLETYANQNIPFEMLVDELKPERALSYNPLAQIKFVLQNFATPSESAAFTLPGLEIEGVGGAEERIRFDLDLTASESANGVHFNWSFKDELFELSTIERMASAFRVMLEAIVAAPETKVHELPLMDEAARTAMLAQSRGEVVTTGRDACVQSLFEAQAEQTPASLAVNDVTYEQLNAKANRLAHYLQEQGIERGTRVGLYVERSAEVLIGMLGILKAGATYVPFEPSNTAERLRHIISNGEIECVLTHSSLVDKLPVKGIDVVTLDDAAQDEDWFSEYPSTNPETEVSLDDSAYVIYTSGSTGVPKGVEITHHGLTDYLAYASERYYAAHLSGSLVVTSHGFDITVPSLYLPLLRGGRVQLTTPGEELMELVSALRNDGTDGKAGAYLLRMTPMHVTGMLALLPEGTTCAEPHVFVIGGEAFPLSLARELQTRFSNAQIFNHYGPTETVVGCSIYDVTAALRGTTDRQECLSHITAGQSTENQKPKTENHSGTDNAKRTTDNARNARLPIGRPMANQELYVLNEALQLAPVGVPGELCIGGAGVAKGYVNQPDVTAAKFLANPFGDGRIYRSGDLVRYLPTGDLEFMGRLDDQIKIRGFRIELGEIETSLKTQDGVKDALVVATGEGENKSLVAYVVATPADEGSFISTLKTRLKQALPEYMVPSAWCVLEAFPLNANGKIDRKALPAVDRKSGSEYVAPSNATEEKLAAIWSQVLGLTAPLSVTANFFELGGHSLLATRVVSAVSQEFRKSMPVRTLFEYSTVQALAAHVEALAETEHRSIKPAPRDQALPLSFAQQRLWFVDQLEPDSPQYNIPIGLRLTGKLDRQALQTALDTLVARHEVLRTIYRDNAQLVQPAQPLVIAGHDLTQLEGDVREARVQELATAEARRIFKLDADLMLRVSLLTLAETEHVLLFTMHHIASDAWSLGIVVREFVTLYSAFHAGQLNPLAPLPIQYGDYAWWQRTNFQGDEQLAYWKEQLSDAPPVHGLPLDRPRAARQSFEGGRAAIALGKEQLERLNELARAHNASLFMVLQAAFALLVARWSNETDVVMGTPVAGRNHRDTESLIGFFLNTLVLRTRISDGQTFHDLIEQARETHLAAHQHGELPFEAIVEALNPERSLVHTPIFQLLINMNNTGESNLSLPELEVAALEQHGTHDSKYDITLYLKEQAAGLNCTWAYNRHLFREESIELMTREFASLVENLTRNPQLPVLAHAWGEQSSAVWNEPKTRALRNEGLIQRRIEQQQPGAVALIGKTRTLTYGQLNAEANQLARVLRETYGIVEGDRVAIYSERSEARIVAILGIIKAGAVYVPLSQELPAKRLEYMATNAKSRVLLTDSNSERALLAGSNVGQALLPDANVGQTLLSVLPIVKLDDPAFLAACASQTTEPLTTTITADSPAHIIYTSGSTGNPKGVLGTHGATVNRADWMLGEFPFAEGERASHITSMAFIRGIWELFTPLCAGVPLVLFDRDVVKDAARFVPMLREQGITRVVTAPSLMRSLLDYLSDSGETLDTLRYWFVSGEALSVDIARRVDRALPNVGIFNLYGSTEVLSDVLFTSVRGHEHTSSVPLGKAIDNVAVTIVDSRNNPVPNGVVGQLVVTGRCVALGYEGLEELTSKQFIETPAGRGYRTGDLARVLPCGNVEYLGRIDHQTKIRGYRIEPGEIEAQLNALESITHAAVTTRNIAGETRLLAYVVFDKSSCSLTTDAERVAGIKRELKAILPEFMIPSAFTVMAELPLTANGKVNRKALPEPDFTATIEYVEASTPTQAAVAAIWQEILKLDRVSVTADFFELGGHSLLATRVASAVSQRLNKKVTVRNLFEHNTVETLSAFLDGEGSADYAPIPRVSRDERLLLSFAQQRLWFIDQLEEGSAQYNMPLALRLTGNFRFDALQRALDAIVVRHEVIRSTYHLDDGAGIQVVHPARPVPIVRTDLTELDASRIESEVQHLLREEAARPFDLKGDLMLRAQVITVAADEHVLLFTMHHIASDVWSVGVLVREFVALYKAYCLGSEPSLQPLPVQYADFAAWQRARMDGGDLERQLSYWKNQLGGAPAVHSLPLDRPRPAQQQFFGASLQSRLDRGLLNGLQRIAAQQQATLFMVLQTALATLFSRWSGSDDIVIGTPVAGRNHRDVEPLIGYFVNTLVLRSAIAHDASFSELLERGRQTVLDAFSNQDVPFEMLVDELKPERSLSHSPLYQLLFVLQNTERSTLELPELTVSAVGSEQERAKLDLSISANETEDGVSLSWNYAVSLFDQSTIARLASSFEVMLRAIVDEPSMRSSELPIMTAAEESAIVARSSNVKPYPEYRTLHALFEEQAALTPSATALVFEGQSLTYGELDRRSNQLAHYLRERGVERNVLVGICIERSLEMVVGLFGILKAGGAYVPLDAGYPKDRLAYMLDDSGVRVVVTQSKLVRDLDVWGDRETVCLDTQWAEMATRSAEPIADAAAADDLAYMIYTSGSTGKPKGALNRHRGICNRLYWMQDEYRLNASDRVLQKTPFSFDVSVWEFFWPLTTGTTLVIAKPEGHRDGEYLAQLIVDERVTTIHFVPSMLNVFLQTADASRCTTLRRVICSGEALPPELAKEFFRHLSCELHNLYGPTEAAVDVTNWQCEDGRIGSNVPIGRPIANTSIYVLDRNLRPVPDGVAGELYIGGVQVGAGYHGRPELTAERFIADPFDETGRLYRTGDLVRNRADGVIEYLGRIDHQVKIRGFRIELGEIEAQILQQPEVKEALVAAKGEGTDKRLVAYVVPVNVADNAADLALIESLKSALKLQLPEYMVPTAFVVLPAFPLSSNGKIDRKALPEPDWQLTSAYVAPRNETEEQLAAIWSKLLKLERVGVEDNFFAIGGDSILSILVVSRANQAGIPITTRQLFEHQTIASLAAHAEQSVGLEMPQEPMTGAAALLPIQTQLLEEEGADRHHFNQSVLLQTPEAFSADFLRAMVAALYTRHDALRLRYTNANGAWQAHHEELTEQMLDASTIVETLPADATQHAAFITERCNHHQRTFNLATGPLFRAIYFTPAEGTAATGRLFLVAHHIVVDGVSWRILLSDIEQAYHQFTAGEPVVLAPKTSSFQQWGAALEQYAQSPALAAERKYWLGQYEHDVEPLPVDYDFEARMTQRSTKRALVRLTAAETQALIQQCAPVYRTTINELLLAGLYLGMRRWTDSSALRIALEGHGRESLFEHLDTTQTVGWFTTVFPLTLSSRGTATRDVIKSIKEQYRAIPNNGIGYGVLRHMAHDAELVDKAEANPPQLVFNYLGQFDSALSKDTGFQGAAESSGDRTSIDRVRRYQLGLNGRVANGVLEFGLDYSSLQYDIETMQQLAGFIEAGLRDVIEHCLSVERGEYTPSDFPLASVSQPQLDEWQQTYPSLTRLYPATAMQQGMLFHSMLDSGAYVTQFCPTFSGPLDIPLFREAWRTVVARHDVFRTAFVGEGKGLHQLVVAAAEMPWVEEDWRGLPDDEQRERFESYRADDRTRGFDIAVPPLQRIAIFRLGEDRYQLLWSQHHMLIDGWCKAMVHKEVVATYMALARGQVIALPETSDYESYMRWLQSRDDEESRAYWREYLAKVEAPTPLVVDRSRKGVAGGRESHYTIFSDSESRRLDAFAKANHTTVNTLVQLAWAYLLHRYSGDEQVLFGSVISGRPAEVPGIETMVGLFINTIPVRVSFEGKTKIAELIAELQREFQTSQDHGYLPLNDVQACTKMPQGVPFFDSLLIFENYPLETSGGAITAKAADAGAANLRVETMRTDERTNFKLSLVAAFRGRLTLKFSYSVIDFDQPTIELLLEHLAHVLRQLPRVQDLRDVELLTPTERESLAAWNDTAADYPANDCIHQLFEAQAARTPEAEALVVGDESLTYRELNERANQLAHALIEQGVGPDMLVGVSCTRSFELVVGILGILKAGGAYVPFDPSYPADRLKFMIDDSAVRFIVTTQTLRNRLPLTAQTVILADRADQLRTRPKSNPVRPELTPSNLAYVIYTSGSTGAPKGVLVEHRGLVNLINADIRTLRLDGKQRVLHCLSLSFDAGTEHLFNALCGGATTYMVEPNSDLMEVAVEQRITQLRMPVAVLEAQPVTDLPYLNAVVVGGEACSRRVVETWSKRARFFNQYGPTECTVTSTMAELSVASDVLHMGRFVENQYGYVVDAKMNRCPIGVPGELLIGGAGVARGYLNRPELTADRFIKDPFSADPNARVYRTGDWVRLLPDGNVEFVGRRDAQLKIRGFRIELGEIQQVLLQQAGVQDAIVIARGEGRDKRLCAYVISNASITDDATFIDGVQQALRVSLPEPMVPSDFVALTSFPLTPNGKVDQRALPEPGLRRAAATTEALTPVQQTIATVWCEYLKIAEAGLDDEFFDIGGDSLDLMSVVAELKRRGLEVTVRQALENKTIRELAAAIVPVAAVQTPASLAAEYLVRLNDGAGSTPLFVVHPFGGKIDCYTGLAAGLNDVCTVYGIQAPFNFNHDLRFDTLEQLATTYVEAIKYVQAEGPYRLAGWSAGGTIAYEIARQLETGGDSVDYLGLFDAPPPGVLTETQSDREYLLTAARYADAGIRTKVEGLVLPDQLDDSVKAVVDLIIQDEAQARLTRNELETALRFGVNFCRSHGTSSPARLILRGTTTLYLAVDEKTKVIPAAEVEALLGSPLRTVSIASDHTHLMSGPGLAAIVADARQQLAVLAEATV
ncbi:MAG TPA: amino acid adenylation domain-containing protein [Thermoanaerobaculia bacterium]|jgi:amino acid adenylation domain-containing protein/non-ribosomal peptide synthase protein (TIGR01720 family)